MSEPLTPSADGAVGLQEWVELVCREFGLARPDIPVLLDLARDVAHRVTRPAAPVTALLAGLAVGEGLTLPDVVDRIRNLLPADPAGSAAAS